MHNRFGTLLRHESLLGPAIVVVRDPRRFFEGVRYVGRVRAQRKTYEVYDAGTRYLLVWPSTRTKSSYYMSEVPASLVADLRKRMRGRLTTSVDARKRLGGPTMRHLNALYVLVATGDAKIQNAKKKPIVFRVYA